ncbi:MAG: 50S ribosomal protein L29 [Deltaproteobacteria bacterium]|nr:50S ribosomal protein L29 [Deltaproteobacteria bacterium]MCZ6623277.1 50S ribosomal protein L29 [Deltaproteobacteria bacterium]
MEAKQMREMSANELAQKREDLKEEIFHLKLRLATSQLENPMKLGQSKRDLARLETILKEKMLQGREG